MHTDELMHMIIKMLCMAEQECMRLNALLIHRCFESIPEIFIIK